MSEERFFEHNVVSAIFAVLCLVLIALAIYKIYSVATFSEEKKNVQNLLDILKAKIDALQNEQSTEYLVQGFSKDWYIVSWHTENPKKPDKCFFKNCICICKSASSARVASEGTDCQKNGFCRELEFDYVRVDTPYPGAEAYSKNPRPWGNFIKIDNELFKIKIQKFSFQGKKGISIIREYENE